MADVTLILKANNSDHINKMKQSQTETQKVYDISEKGAKREKGILEEIDATIQRLEKSRRKAFSYEEIEKYNKKLDEAKLHLKEYEEAGKKVEQSGNTLLQSIGKWALGFATITAAVKLFKDIIESTDTLSDKFKVTLKGWEEGFKAIKRAIANEEFKNFFENVRTAVAEGQRFAQTEERISEAARAMKVRIAENETAIIKLREVQNSATKSEKERLEAGKEAQELIRKNSEERVKLTQAIYDNDIKNAAFISKQTEQIVKNYLLQEPMIMRQVEIGKEYNNLMATRQTLMNLISEGALTIDNEELKAVNEKIKALGSEGKMYGELAIGLGNITDAQQEKLTSDLEAIETAKQSAINLRVSSKIENLIAKDKKENGEDEKELNKELLDDKIKMEQWTNEYFENEKKRNEEKRQQDQDLLNDKVLMEKYTNEFFENEKRRDEEELDRKKKKADEEKKLKFEILSATVNLTESTAALTVGLFNNELEKATWVYDTESNMLEAKYDRDLKNAGNNIQAKARAEKEYVDMKTRLDQKYEATKREIARKSALAEKVSALFSIGINTAVAIVKSLPNLLLVALVAAAGAAQAALVAATPLPKLAKGGWTGRGRQRDETGERVAGIVHEEEFVIKRGNASKYREVLEAINRDDKKMIFNSFNKINPELLGGTTVNNIVVDNKGSNNRLDELIKENKKLNDKIANRELIQNYGNVTIVQKGSTTRIIRK